VLTPKLWKTPKRSRCSAALRRKRSALTGGQRAYARIQREGASAPPAPTPRKYKSKNLAVGGGAGPAFVPECRAVRDRTERPQDEHGAMPPAPVYPKCVYGHSATGPRVLNPVFRFASGRVDFAPRTSPVRAFFRAPIDVRGLRTFARQFPRAVAASLRISAARVPARGVRAHGKDSCWIVTLTSGGAVHRGEQAVVSSAAISIKDSKPKPAEFIQQRFCYRVTGWLWQGRQRSGRRRTGRIGRLRAITESAG
jgi:hypothetical protein